MYNFHIKVTSILFSSIFDIRKAIGILKIIEFRFLRIYSFWGVLNTISLFLQNVCLYVCNTNFVSKNAKYVNRNQLLRNSDSYGKAGSLLSSLFSISVSQSLAYITFIPLINGSFLYYRYTIVSVMTSCGYSSQAYIQRTFNSIRGFQETTW